MNGVSVIICTYNGKNRISQTLDSLLQQRFNELIEWELIVVDNASVDETGTYCAQYLNEQQLKYRIVLEPKAGLNNARKKGFEVAQYYIVLFCDDDNILSTHYVQRGYQLMHKHPQIGVLGGCGEPLFETKKPEWFERYSHSFAVGTQAAASGALTTKPAEVYGAGAFFRKDILLKAFSTGYETLLTDRKGNELNSGGDVEWCYIVQLAGYEVWYDEDLRFQHMMSSNRLQWSYYLQLKKGISKGVASLFAYAYILQNKKHFLFSFLIYYFLQLLDCSKRYFGFQIKKSVGAYEAETLQLGEAVLRTRLNSFLKNIPSALAQYKKIRSLEHALHQHHSSHL